MKQFISWLCVLLFTLATASDITNHHEREKISNHGENYDMYLSPNDVNIAITHMKRLKKLIYMLSDPKFDIRDNTQTKDFERIGKAYNLNPSEMKRAERGLKDFFEKSKEFFKNIFNKKKGKGKSKKAAAPDDLGSGEAGNRSGPRGDVS